MKAHNVSPVILKAAEGAVADSKASRVEIMTEVRERMKGNGDWESGPNSLYDRFNTTAALQSAAGSGIAKAHLIEVQPATTADPALAALLERTQEAKYQAFNGKRDVAELKKKHTACTGMDTASVTERTAAEKLWSTGVASRNVCI